MLELFVGPTCPDRLVQYGEARIMKYNGEVYLGQMECGMPEGFGALVCDDGGSCTTRVDFVMFNLKLPSIA